MRSQNEKIRHLLDQIGRAVTRAMSRSSELSAAIRRAGQEGFSLHLVLDGREDGAGQARIELTPRPLASDSREPVFRLSGEDVEILRSVGIDPTRSVRRRRKRHSTI